MKKAEKTIVPVARIRSDFPQKFGIPRQSSLALTRAEIHFEPEFRSAEAVRELEKFSWIWLIWGFSKNEDVPWHPTVRPPRLGGNKRVGVFASRSPFRPNGLGLSSVRLLKIDFDSPDSPVLIVEGADLADGTPIYDIKPYLSFCDSHPDAAGGYTVTHPRKHLSVCFPDRLIGVFPEEKRQGLLDLLAEDPRPSYQNDPEKIYGLSFAGYNIKFTVSEDTLTVTDIQKCD